MSDLFKQYPNMSEYFETSDGTAFFKEDPAKVHARTLKDSKVKTVSRPEETEEPKPETVKDIIAVLVNMDLETVQKFLDAENERDLPRKTVIDALEKRIAELETPA